MYKFIGGLISTGIGPLGRGDVYHRNRCRTYPESAERCCSRCRTHLPSAAGRTKPLPHPSAKSGGCRSRCATIRQAPQPTPGRCRTYPPSPAAAATVARTSAKRRSPHQAVAVPNRQVRRLQQPLRTHPPSAAGHTKPLRAHPPSPAAAANRCRALDPLVMSGAAVAMRARAAIGRLSRLPQPQAAR